MTTPDLKQTIQEILPQLIAEDPLIRDFVLRTVSTYYAGKEETESRFDLVLAELQRDREEQSRRWKEQYQENQGFLARLDQEQEENNRRWEENNRRWEEQHQENQRFLDRLDQEQEENNRRWEESQRRWEESQRRWEEQHQQNQQLLAEIQNQNRRYDSTIGALGSRWGLYSEASFRNALKGILEHSFGVQVLNITDFDEAGEVFGRPDQVELDIIIQNGQVIVCEIKSSLSKSDMYSFDRKVAFYQKRHQRPVSRKLVICPMVDDRALPVAEVLGIEVYSYADAVKNL
jgi:hypothetical protein